MRAHTIRPHWRPKPAKRARAAPPLPTTTSAPGTVASSASSIFLLILIAAGLYAVSIKIPVSTAGVLLAPLESEPPPFSHAHSTRPTATPISLSPVPLPPAASLLPEDAAFAATLLDLLKIDGDPWDIARDAWEVGRVWPATFIRPTELFVRPPPAELAEALSPEALDTLVATKKRDFSIVMPGNAETAIFKYDQELEYYAEYAASWKAWTWKKGGVDCNRHLEIVSSGVIPIFRDIRSVPRTTLFNYPKHLMAFFEDNKDETNVRHLAMMRFFILHWAHKHLKAPNSVLYMTRASDYTAEKFGLPARFTDAARAAAPPRIAFIDSSLPQAPDYMSNFLLYGLVEHFGADNVDIFYPVQYMYKGGPAVDGRGNPLYGHGYGYRHKLARPSVQPDLSVMLARLAAGEYAAAVWGSYTRCQTHLHDPTTVAAYNHQPNRLWLFDGHDSYECVKTISARATLLN